MIETPKLPMDHSTNYFIFNVKSYLGQPLYNMASIDKYHGDMHVMSSSYLYYHVESFLHIKLQ